LTIQLKSNFTGLWYGPRFFTAFNWNASECTYLTDGQHGHSGSQSVFFHDTVRSDSADHHADAADQEGDHEQRPAEIVTREDVAVEQIGVVGETKSSCRSENNKVMIILSRTITPKDNKIIMFIDTRSRKRVQAGRIRYFGTKGDWFRVILIKTLSSFKFKITKKNHTYNSMMMFRVRFRLLIWQP